MNLQALRIQFSQQDIALALDLPRERISEWERGVRSPTRSARMLLSVLGDVSRAWLDRGWSLEELRLILRSEGLQGALEALY